MRLTGDRTELLLRLDLPVYLPQVEQVVHEASRGGYARAQLSECLAVEALSLVSGRPRERRVPFADRRYVMSFSNLDLFEDLPSRVPPYTIYPFDDRACWDLVTGVNAMQEVIEKVGPKYSPGTRLYVAIAADANQWD